MTTTSSTIDHQPSRAVLVTGASRGLGALMARRLADLGDTVFAGARDVASVATVPGVVPVQLDVTDGRSIAAAVATVTEHLGDRGLHAVVNNAGILRAGPLEHVPTGVIERQLRTNVVGPISVVQAFLPLVRLGRGRIVNVSSVNADLVLPFWGVYSATKAALDAASDALRMELEPWAIPVTVMTLGAFATDIRTRGLDGWPDGTDLAYGESRAVTAALVRMLDATAGHPDVVAEALLDVLAAPEPPARCLVGSGVDDLLALAAQPADVRSAMLRQLTDSAVNTPA